MDILDNRDRGDANYGTPDSRRLRFQIRQGIIQGPSPIFDAAVAAIYSLERAQEANGKAEFRGAGTSVS